MKHINIYRYIKTDRWNTSISKGLLKKIDEYINIYRYIKTYRWIQQNLQVFRKRYSRFRKQKDNTQINIYSITKTERWDLFWLMTSKHISFYINLFKLLFFQTMGSGERVTSSDIVQVFFLPYSLGFGCGLSKKNRIYLILFFLVSSLFYLNRYSTNLQ